MHEEPIRELSDLECLRVLQRQFLPKTAPRTRICAKQARANLHFRKVAQLSIATNLFLATRKLRDEKLDSAALATDLVQRNGNRRQAP